MFVSPLVAKVECFPHDPPGSEEPRRKIGRGGRQRSKRDDRSEKQLHTGRSPFTVTRVPERVCGQ